MRELSLFSGIGGGGIYGSLILGWETAAYVEKDEYCQAVIRQQIADGWFNQGNMQCRPTTSNKQHKCSTATTLPYGKCATPAKYPPSRQAVRG